MAKQSDKSELAAAYLEVLGALSSHQRQILEALYEQAIVGRALNLSDVAKGLGLPYATTYDRTQQALREFGRQVRTHTAIRNWLQQHAINEQAASPLGQSSALLNSQWRRLEFFYHLSEADDEILSSSAGPLGPQETEAAVPLSECLGAVDTIEGRTRVAEYLNSQPFPHYESAGRDGLLVRIEENGSRTIGRFIDGQFLATQC